MLVKELARDTPRILYDSVILVGSYLLWANPGHDRMLVLADTHSSIVLLVTIHQNPVYYIILYYTITFQYSTVHTDGMNKNITTTMQYNSVVL